MNLLAFDTSTDSLSIAVQRGAQDMWQHTGAGGAQTSATMIPLIQGLMVQAELRFEQLDAIVFGRGPGSFTGLRTACAVAQGLAFGANIKVLPIDTLLALAEQARYQRAAGLAQFRVLALLDARMDEMYAATYFFHDGYWRQTQDCCLLYPQDLVCDAGMTLAGNVFAAYGERLPGSAESRVAALPTATALLRLAPAMLAAGLAVPADQALPLYVRDKVASTTLERAAQKEAR